MRPLVLLDVDGVLNALGPPGRQWPDWRHGSASALGREWPIRWSPTVVEAVHGWLDVAEVRWLTTWGAAANLELRGLLGLPELTVAGTPDDDGDAGSADDGPESLAAVTPAAPDELTGRWWKFDVVRRTLDAQPDRRLVWLDDDLAEVEDVRDWTRAHTDCLLVAPDPRAGLVRDHLAAVARFLAGELS